MNITISDKTLKLAVSNLVEANLDHFEKKILKAVGVPPKKELVKQILAEESFIKSLENVLSERIKDEIIFDIMFDVRSKILLNYVDQCDNYWSDSED
jgi:hypothetical protein